MSIIGAATCMEPSATIGSRRWPSAGTSMMTHSSETMTTEHLALIGFAARLGTAVSHDLDGDSASVREEAQLLINLMRGGQSQDKNSSSPLSFKMGSDINSNEWNPSPGEDSALRGIAKADTPTDYRDIFSFTCPSLSLESGLETHDRVSSSSSSVTPGDDWRLITPSPPSTPDSGHEGDDDAQEAMAPSLSPPALLSRNISTNDRDHVTSTAEAVARNVIKSFEAALQWRALSWIDSLAQVVYLRAQEHHKLCETRTLLESGQTSVRNHEGLSDPDGDDEECQTCQNDEEYSEENQNEGRDRMLIVDPMESDEAKVIASLLRASSEVRVRDVSTSFRVLPNRISDSSNHDCSSGEMKKKPAALISKPPPKKRRARLVSDDNEDESRRRYHVTHVLAFEATISVLTSVAGIVTVKLQAPGSIKGSFLRPSESNSSDYSFGAGDEVLTGVTVSIDTMELSASVERQSRFITRKAAEACILSEAAMIAEWWSEATLEGYFFPNQEYGREGMEEQYGTFPLSPPQIPTTPRMDGQCASPDYPTPTKTHHYHNTEEWATPTPATSTLGAGMGAVVVTPRHYAASPPFSSCDSDRDLTEELITSVLHARVPPPAPPSLANRDSDNENYDKEDETSGKKKKRKRKASYPSLRRVSPPPGSPSGLKKDDSEFLCSSSSSLLFTPRVPSSNGNTVPASTATPGMSVLPSLVSPPTSSHKKEFERDFADCQEDCSNSSFSHKWRRSQIFPASGGGPSLPALLEVACAARSETSSL